MIDAGTSAVPAPDDYDTIPPPTRRIITVTRNPFPCRRHRASVDRHDEERVGRSRLIVVREEQPPRRGVVREPASRRLRSITSWPSPGDAEAASGRSPRTPMPASSVHVSTRLFRSSAMYSVEDGSSHHRPFG
jgi:hypothetical protein